MKRCIRCWFVPSFAVLSGLLTAASVYGADAWPSPKPKCDLDFFSEESVAQPVFSEKGLALEIDLSFLMTKHKKVVIDAKLPKPGQFEIEQLGGDAAAKLARKGPNRYEVTAKLSALWIDKLATQALSQLRSIDEAAWNQIDSDSLKMDEDALKRFMREQNVGGPWPAGPNAAWPRDKEPLIRSMRKTCAYRRFVDKIQDELRRRLEEIATARSYWALPEERQRWKSAKPTKLCEDFLKLTSYGIMDEHLKKFGMDRVNETPAATSILEGRFQSLYLIMAGRVQDDPGQAAKIPRFFDDKEIEQLRKLLTVNLRCRLYQETDAEDANSQWFNAQRVACRAKGVGVIRIEGKLDPTKHDRADWWFLEGYNPATVLLKADESPGFSMESPLICGGGARVRFVAKGNKPADYALELQPVGAGQDSERVLIHESPSWTGAKFPF